MKGVLRHERHGCEYMLHDKHLHALRTVAFFSVVNMLITKKKILFLYLAVGLLWLKLELY